MDTSKEYIKMCEQAVEIQTRTEIIFAQRISDIVIVNGEYWYYEGADSNNCKKVWLPRQDQLQEIFMNYALVGVPGLIRHFNLFWEQIGFDFPLKYNSIEQLWLAFVMKEKYNKVWNGKDWINGTN